MRPQGVAGLPALGLATAVAVLAGAGLGLLLPWVPPWWILAPAVVLGLAGWWRGGCLRIAGALLFGLAWAGSHAAWVLGAQLPSSMERETIRVSGRIVDLPQGEPRRTRFRLRVDDDPRQPEPLRGALLQLSWYDDFGATGPGPRTRLQAGARWRLDVKLRAPRGLANPGGFDSERYALAQRIAASGYVRDPAAAVRLAPPAGINAWRERMSTRIGEQAGGESSRFIRALALGDTQALEQRDWETLRAVGLTHLIAISGFHVGLVAGFAALLCAGTWRLFPRLGRWLPRPQAAAAAALVGAVGYAAVAGFALPTVRTVLMIAVVVLARASRRPLGAADSLARALLAVLTFDPLPLLAPGFWLSFAGVAWLMWCLPNANGPAWRQFLSAQGAATLGLLPLTVLLFGQASLAGPFANLVAIPWWSLVVVPLSLAGTGLEAMHAGWGSWAWRAAAWCFDLSWTGFSVLGQSRFALWWLPEARWFAVPLALLGAFWLLLPRAVPGKALAALLWLPLLWPDRQLPAVGEVELMVVDVGQGLSVLVRTQRHALLYDAGPAVLDGFDAGERAVVPALRALGVARLDRVVLGHGDSDHAGGFEAVRRVVPVGRLLAPAGASLPLDQGCVSGLQWQWDGVTFRFLHPTPHFPYLGNEASCVLRIETAHGAALLTGDIGEVIERELLRRAPADLRAEVVLAPHHGSAGSSAAAFVQATGARLAIMSTGFGNRFGHPRPDVTERWQASGAEVLDTARSGAIRVWLGGEGLAVRERRGSRARLWDAVRLREAATLSYRSENERPQAPED
jgi:competence protein ComEC